MLGYDVAPAGGRLVVNEDEAEQVREIFRLYTRHRSLAAVAEELNRRGWRTKIYHSQRGKHHGGRCFQETTLLHLLTNALYVGKVEHGGELYAGEQPGMIEPSVWDPIQEELRARIGQGKRNGDKEKGLLNGLLFCHLCERPMAHTNAAARGRQYRYYVCRPPHKRGLRPCPTRAVSARAIEESVVVQLQRQLGEERGVWDPREMEGFVRKLVERVSYDGTTGGVELRLATIDTGGVYDA